MARFILYIFFNEAKEHEEDARLAVSLGERVLSESVDHAQRTGVIHTLAMLWHELGDDEQAKKYASMLGSYYTTSGQALGLVLRGEECREQRCRNIIEVTGLLANTILYLPSLGGEMPDKDIVCAKKTLALFDLIYEDGDYEEDLYAEEEGDEGEGTFIADGEYVTDAEYTGELSSDGKVMTIDTALSEYVNSAEPSYPKAIYVINVADDCKCVQFMEDTVETSFFESMDLINDFLEGKSGLPITLVFQNNELVEIQFSS